MNAFEFVTQKFRLFLLLGLMNFANQVGYPAEGHFKILEIILAFQKLIKRYVFLMK